MKKYLMVRFYFIAFQMNHKLTLRYLVLAILEHSSSCSTFRFWYGSRLKLIQKVLSCCRRQLCTSAAKISFRAAECQEWKKPLVLVNRHISPLEDYEVIIIY